MFNSTVIDVAIGLVFIFLTVSFAVSAIVEALASVLGWRSASLLAGIKHLLNDPNFNALARDLYNHGLISPRDAGQAQVEEALKHRPSYIEAGQFADALMEITKTASGAPEQIEAEIAAIHDQQLQRMFTGIYARSAGDVSRMRTALAAWFDNGMDRVGGAYKRKTQLCAFLIAVVVVVVCNVSAITVTRALWQQPLLAHTFAPSPGLDLAGALAQIKQAEIPVGWTGERYHQLCGWWGLEMAAGWLVTALATLFGAPFWFDTLQQFVRLKGAGPSPQEKKAATAASA